MNLKRKKELAAQELQKRETNRRLEEEHEITKLSDKELQQILDEPDIEVNKE